MLVLEIKNLLDANKINFNDLDLTVVTHGPGSYTGIRVALAVSKIIKITVQKPILTVNCCEVLAYKYSKNYSKINVAIQANKDEVYFAKYVANNNLEEVASPIISSVDDILLEIKEDEFLCGSANKITISKDLKILKDNPLYQSSEKTITKECKIKSKIVKLTKNSSKFLTEIKIENEKSIIKGIEKNGCYDQ
jgi:tRNA threonylcarbamoyladenosine biosynthesis protein TsaB